MVGWRSVWRADVHEVEAGSRGEMWQFSAPAGRTVWTVARTEDGPFPLFSAVRGEGPMPDVEQLWDMTQVAVAALFPAVIDDGDTEWFVRDTEWFVRNIATSLMMASTDVFRWEGLEEPIETTVAGQPTLWAAPGAARTPYSWLRALGTSGAINIAPYQENLLDGLQFDTDPTPGVPPAAALGWLRPRNDIPLVRGAIRRVDLAFDTQAAGLTDPGVFSEVLLRSEREATLLIAADAYFQDEWHLHEDAVVAVPDLPTADDLQWTLGRRSWRPPDLPTV